MSSHRGGPGPAPVPVDRSLKRLRLLLTGWSSLVLAVSLATAMAMGVASGTVHGTVWLFALLGLLAVTAYASVTWIVLDYLLAPVTRSLVAQESFLTTAAHDLRTPLATLAALLATARDDPTARADAMERAGRIVTHGGDIVENLLLRARLSAGLLPVHLRPTRLDQVVERVVAGLAGADPAADADEGGSVTVAANVDGHRITLVSAPIIALIDPVLAERAVANLVQNALRHGHAPGEAAVVRITVSIEDGRAVVTVADSGPGWRPPVRRTGLGVAVARWVARQHDGALLLGTGAEPGTRIRLAFTAC